MTLTERQVSQLSALHTAVVSDITDDMGIRDNALSHEIRPLWGRETVVGAAHAMQTVPIGYETEDPADHYEGILNAIEAIEPGDVVVRAAQGDTRAGAWGELLSTAAMSNGAVGAVIDGLTRDARKIDDHGFPVWARGHSPIDSKGRFNVREHGVPVSIGGITVEPGDVVMADYEGIVTIPPAMLDDVIDRATEKYENEDTVRDEIRSGRSLHDVFQRHGIL